MQAHATKVTASHLSQQAKRKLGVLGVPSLSETPCMPLFFSNFFK
ncbi:hypothetical protein VVMO6_04062 [Vibrio vulnificus MO6-24/O]|nr:hypothetical protein VVMO6_04062 [Vibrio vulnificus MO6-24/O]